MLIFIKKWNFVALCAVLLLSVGVLGLSLRPAFPTDGEAVSLAGKTIIVDAGHGEPDGGAAGSSGVLEKDLNLSVAVFLEKALCEAGAEVVMTRTGDSGIFDATSQTIRQKKRSDLANRQKIMENADASLFVSIHMNRFSDSKYSGPQVFYASGGADSKVLAQAVQKRLVEELSPPSVRQIKAAGGDIYLLKQAKLPAVLVECGFLSNPEEERLLLSEAYQKKVAEAICHGICDFLTS